LRPALVPEATIGERIRWHRELLGKSQTVIANLVGRSEDWLSKVERDQIPIDRLSVIIGLARALRVRDIADLIGPSFSLSPGGVPKHDSIAGIRLALSTPPSVLAQQTTGEPLTVAQLGTRVSEAWTRYETETRRYATLGPELPGLLADGLRTTRLLDDGPDRTEALRVMSSLYGLVQFFTYRLGEKDVARVAADRALVAAEETEDIAVIVDATRRMAGALMSSPDIEQAMEISLRTIEYARGYVDDHPSEYARSALGSLHLAAVISSARAGYEARAWNQLHEAERYAQGLSPVANHTRSFFNTTNIAMHYAHLHVECGEASDAAGVGRKLVIPPGATLERVIRFGVDQMQAARLTKDWDTALAELDKINQRSPEEMGFHVLIRETARDLLKHTPTGRSVDVQRLAQVAGVL
jgi:transcriptional regulator with XRE-family HTH domain